MFGHRASAGSSQDPRVDALIKKPDKSGFAVWAQMEGRPSSWNFQWGLGGSGVGTVHGGFVIPVDCQLLSLALANDAPRTLSVGLYAGRGTHPVGAYLGEVVTINSKHAVNTHIDQRLRNGEVINFRTRRIKLPAGWTDPETGGDLGSTATAWFRPL